VSHNEQIIAVITRGSAIAEDRVSVAHYSRTVQHAPFRDIHLWKVPWPWNPGYGSLSHWKWHHL